MTRLILPDKQRRALHVIEVYYAATGEACPLRYIGRRLNLHPSTVAGHIEKLYRKGWLRAPNGPAIPTHGEALHDT